MTTHTDLETLHTYDVPEGKAHMMAKADGTFVLVSDLGEPIARMSDLGEAIRDLAGMGLDPAPVADAQWERIKRRKLARSLAQEARDELSLSLNQIGVTHAAGVEEGTVIVTLTVEEALQLCDHLSGETQR